MQKFTQKEGGAIWLSVENLNCKVVRATDDEREWLNDYLSFKDGRAHFAHRSDPYVRMFSMVSNTFATGFLGMVKKAAAEAGFDVQTMDKRIKPGEVDPTADLSWLRDYQLEGVNKVVHHERGILWCPTGSGKTEVAVGLVLKIPCRWLFVVHRATLMHQAADRYELRTKMPAGRIGEGVWDPQSKFTCATFQTLHARLEDPECLQFLDEAEGLIVDEAHTLPADSFRRVAMKTRRAYYRVGMSGTPLARGDKRSILTIAVTGKTIYRIKSKTLIDAGVLALPKIKVLPVVQTSDKPTWQGVYGECIVRSPKRNKVIAYAAQKAAKPCLVFVKEISHGKVLKGLLSKAGVKCEFVWGSDTHERRMASVTRLVRGDIEVLICSVIFNEGVDIPSLASVVIGSGGKSIIAALQRIGRGMRTDDGKKTSFEVFDILDKGNKWLDNHSRARLRAYQSESYEVAIDEGAAQLAGL